MKWNNRDIYVVEQANIQKMSKLDDIGSPLRLFEHCFLVDMIAGYNELYGHSEKADTSFEITNEIFRLFFAMLLLRVCHKLPDRKTYW